MTEPAVIALLPSSVDNIVAFVKTSNKAKRPRLEICPYGTVTLIAPRRFSARNWTGFLHDNTQWITQTLEKIDRHRHLAPQLHTIAPTTIHLPAVGEIWQIKYSNQQRRGVNESRDAASNQLTVRSVTENEHLRHLQAWVRTRAREALPIRLRELSHQTDLRFTGVTVRAQKTRWGSCTRSGAISLNQNLLFLSEELKDYLMIHELCHTVHMSHSARYWALVKRFAPDYRLQESRLRHAANQIPLWAAGTRHGQAWTGGAVIQLRNKSLSPT